jgi:hypothetical protein
MLVGFGTSGLQFSVFATLPVIPAIRIGPVSCTVPSWLADYVKQFNALGQFWITVNLLSSLCSKTLETDIQYTSLHEVGF